MTKRDIVVDKGNGKAIASRESDGPGGTLRNHSGVILSMESLEPRPDLGHMVMMR